MLVTTPMLLFPLFRVRLVCLCSLFSLWIKFLVHRKKKNKCLDLHALCFMPCFPVLCSFVCSMLMLRLHTYMHVWYFGHALLGSTCLHACLYTYMSRSMFSHAHMLRSMFSTCFILFSMCLCALCHVVCLDLGYVCHAMCYCGSFVAFISFSFVLP